MNNSCLPTKEALTIEQFAERLNLSRATVCAWMQRGILQQGRHFFRFGRVVRFVWSDNLLEILLADSERKSEATAPVRTVRPAKADQINWDY